MGKPLISRKKLVLVRIEAAQGVDPGNLTAAADALLVDEADVVPEFQIVERPVLKTTFGQVPHVVGAFIGRWSMTFELKGVTPLGTIPDWDPVFVACGWQRNQTAGVSVVYRPHTTGNAGAAGFEQVATSMTLYVLIDGVRHRLTDCIGSIVAAGAVGERFMVTAEGSGQLTLDAAGTTKLLLEDTAFPAAATFDAALPPVMLSIDLDIDGFDVVASNFSFDSGMEVADRPNMNRLSGWQGSFIANRNMVGTVDPELEFVATEDFLAALDAGRQMALTAEIGGAAGSGTRLELSAPVVQYTSYAYGDRNGAVILDMGLAFKESTGDDELQISLL